MPVWRFWAFLFLFSAFTQPVLAEPFEFASRTYGGFPQLMRGEVQAEISLKAILEVPPGPGPHAALVVAHSCAGWGGVGHGEKMILDAAREAGYATLIHDSFGPRGWKSVCTGEAGTAGNPSVIADAFAALEELSKDPRIKKDAIFIAGAWTTRFVSVGSIAAALALPVASAVVGAPPMVTSGAAVAAAIIVYRHRDNLSRLMSGTERRVSPRVPKQT